MSVVKGLPAELKMDMVSLPDGVNQYAVKVAPQNISSVQSSDFTINATNVAGASIKQITMPSTQINFDIPCGMKNTYIDTAKSTISFRVRYRRVEGSTQLASSWDANLIHNAFNFFNRIFHVSATGTIIDDVPLANLAITNYLQQNVSPQEMDALALPYGFNAETSVSGTSSSNRNSGHDIVNWTSTQTASTTVDKWYSYELPLPSSVIGSLCKGMFPIGDVAKLTLSLVTDAIAPICLNFGAAATASAATVIGVLMQDFALNLSYVDLGQEGSRLLGAGPKVVAGITHRVSSSVVNSGSSGAVSVLMGLRGSSVREITTRVVDGNISTAGSANDKFDSKLLPATSMNYFLLGSQRVPPNPLDVVRQPASVYMRALQATHSFNDRDYKMGSTPQSFCIYSAGATLPSDSDAYLTSTATASKSLATFMFSMPLQKVSKSKILDGLSFQSSNQYFEANIFSGPTYNQTLYFIAELDVLYIITPDGDVQVRI
jgi:hypothetical protein